MNCKRIKKRFLMDYIEGNLEPDQKTLVENHLVNCPQCREHFEEIQRIEHLLKSYAVPNPGEAFWDRLSSGIYLRINTEKPTQKTRWEILHDWMSWKRLAYTAIPILLILLVLFPAYHFYQSHFLKLTHQENVLTVEEIGNGFSLIEECLIQLPANQLEDLLQKMAGLILLNPQVLAGPECSGGLGLGTNEEIFQMRKKNLDLLVKRLQQV
ncbi:MAG: hypothetical protein SRB2_03993 [Desulfobacteraceae bacterium Eth-SRB2]|nr:MAG: hypothetical protein SRB2_03993 [Desulfobacteraceae bacterium Eth-SRB2]